MKEDLEVMQKFNRCRNTKCCHNLACHVLREHRRLHRRDKINTVLKIVKFREL